MQVLTAGTRMEQDQEKGKPMQVTVVTLSVTPEQSERLALASTEGKIQLALRNPLDQRRPRPPASSRPVCSDWRRPRARRRRSGEREAEAGQAVTVATTPRAVRADRRNDPRRQARDGSHQMTTRLLAGPHE